jgi:hypothetical protein
MDLEWIPILAIGGSYILAGFIVWAVVRGRQRRAELKAQVQNKLIDRFTSGPELLQFLESPQGKELIERVEKQPATAATERIINGIRNGIVMTLLGLAFVGFWLFDDNRGMMFPGFILLALGIAFFISSSVSMKLSKSWGLVPREHTENPGS